MCQFVRTLRGLSSAEDFFAALELPFDPAVLAVKRLHILKRFQDYLDGAGVDNTGALGEEGMKALYRAALSRAYQDFLTASPLDHRVFKVLRDAVAGQASTPQGAFVPLTAISRFQAGTQTGDGGR